MEFKLGQKVKYKRINKKIKMNEHYLTKEDFCDDEKKELNRREFIELDNERIGYIAGRRKFTFRTTFQVADVYDADEPTNDEFVDIVEQDYKFTYLVAYDMGKTNYVLEKDLREVK